MNYRYFYKVTPDDADALIDDLRHGRRAHEVPKHGVLARTRQQHPRRPPGRQRRARRQRGAGVAPHRRRPPPEARRRDRHRRAADRQRPASDLDDGHTLDATSPPAATRACKAALAKAPDRGRRRGEGGQPARPRRRRLPGRHQVGLLPARACGRATSWSTATSPSRAPTRTASSWSSDPHQLIEGVLIACYAIGAAQAFLYVRGEMALAQERIAQALNDAYAAGYIGKNILGTDFSVDVVLHWGAGAYIVGEETALIESLEGNRGMPRLKPPFFPAAKGLYLQPTVVNNVETLANLPWIITQRRRHVRRARRRDEPGHAPVRGVGPREATRACTRSSSASPRSATSSTRPSTAAASATATSSRRSSPAARSAPWFFEEHLDLPLEAGRGRRGRLDARLGRRRRDGRHHRRGEGVLAASCASSPASRAASARRAARARAGSRRCCAACSTATAARTTSACCSTSCDNISPGIAWPPKQTDDLPARARRRVADRVAPIVRFQDEFVAYCGGTGESLGGHQRQGLHPRSPREVAGV